MEQQPVWLIALIFVLFVMLPIGFIWSAIKSFYRNIRLRKNTKLVIGKIVETEEILPHLQRNGANKVRLLFEFTSPEGTILRGEASTASLKNNFALHSEHKILVNFAKPGTVHIPENRPYLKAIAKIVIGAAILLVGSNFMLSLN